MSDDAMKTAMNTIKKAIGDLLREEEARWGQIRDLNFNDGVKSGWLAVAVKLKLNGHEAAYQAVMEGTTRADRMYVGRTVRRVESGELNAEEFFARCRSGIMMPVMPEAGAVVPSKGVD